VSAGYALLFTDLVDSTAMIARLGDAAASALLQRHDTDIACIEKDSLLGPRPRIQQRHIMESEVLDL